MNVDIQLGENSIGVAQKRLSRYLIIDKNVIS